MPVREARVLEGGGCHWERSWGWWFEVNFFWGKGGLDMVGENLKEMDVERLMFDKYVVF